MSYGKLAELVMRFIEFFKLVGDDELESRLALQPLEGIAADLAGAPATTEQAAVKGAAKARVAWFDRKPGEHECAARLSPRHRRLLENIASGQVWRQLDETV